MQQKELNCLYNFLLTQKSINGKMPYDDIQGIITAAIQSIKEDNINAKITNVALNINDRLVLAQIYVERKNGFSPVINGQFGTSPTCYNVQLRFPFGFEAKFGQEKLFLPSGDFVNPLEPYKKSDHHIAHDLQFDFDPALIVCGSGVFKKVSDNNKILLGTDSEVISVIYQNELGKGYVNIPMGGMEYVHLHDYNQRLKIAGVYPLFYFSTNKPYKGILRYHIEYDGYTELQFGQNAIVEPQQQEKDRSRKLEYDSFLNNFNETLNNDQNNQSPVKFWQENVEKLVKSSCSYVFNITITNGIALFTDSGLRVTRLRDYQCELFYYCSLFIKKALQKDQAAGRPAALISMGVGAGKTFFTFTLLQHLKQSMKTGFLPLAPAFCMVPNSAVASVTRNTINRQGVSTGTSATAITGKMLMPNEAFLSLYQKLAVQAQDDAKAIDDYIDTGLQQEILNFCENLHPNKIINLLVAKGNYTKRLTLFKDSIDIKRLLLIVEGQKNLMKQTGALSIVALNNLLEEFKAIKKGIEEAKNSKNNMLFNDIFSNNQQSEKNNQILKSVTERLKDLGLNYKQIFELPERLQSYYSPNLNISTITADQLKSILEKKYTNRREKNIRAIRDTIIKIACSVSPGAAILVANSGGLGNTYTEAELNQQIEEYLPVAAEQVSQLAAKKTYTLHDHYTLYLYLNEIFSTIPECINLRMLLRKRGHEVPDLFDQHLYEESLNKNVELIKHIEKKIENKIATVKKLNYFNLDTNILNQYGIAEDMDIIQATHRLAGAASLQLTGKAAGDNADLLLTHISVFTPEGFACYFEHLDSLKGQPEIIFNKNHGVYALTSEKQTISEKDIKERIEQVLSAIMLADEIHKKEFKFLYDSNHPIHQRINNITQKYLNKKFSEVLPARIGMSGTINEVAEKAFGKEKLYNLSIQKMIEKKLTKQIHAETRLLAIEDETEYAKQMVIDYFTSLKEGIPDLFTVSKGLIFSKRLNQELNDQIAYFFNLLLRSHVEENEKSVQKELFEKIYQARKKNPFHSIEWTSEYFQEIQKDAFQNNLFALYLEYILSKSSTPKEFSEIIGLQNKLHENGSALLDINKKYNDPEIAGILNSIESVDPKGITLSDITVFISERIKDKEIVKILCKLIFEYKNECHPMSIALRDLSVPADEFLVAVNRKKFESGATLVMSGSERERTGYSHEPVGIVIDAPADIKILKAINDCIKSISEAGEKIDVNSFCANLEALAKNTFSYDEKNQAGGRALRTPYGHVRYIEYQTAINSSIQKIIKTKKLDSETTALLALKLETSFADIFIDNEEQAQKERASITFNREAFLLLDKCNDIHDFYGKIRIRFSKELNDVSTAAHYENYIQQRLPLIAAMKWDFEKAYNYFLNFDEAIFNDIRQKMSKPDNKVYILEESSDDETSEEIEEIEEVEKSKEFSNAVVNNFELEDGISLEPIIEMIDESKNPQNNLSTAATSSTQSDNCDLLELNVPENTLLSELDKYLTKLENLKNELVIKGDTTSTAYNPRYKNIAVQASTLCQSLKTARDNFSETNEIEVLKKACQAAIDTAKNEFSEHRGIWWGEFHPILRGILGILAAVTLLPAIVVGCASTYGYTATFFGKPLTRSTKKLIEFENTINNIK